MCAYCLVRRTCTVQVNEYFTEEFLFKGRKWVEICGSSFLYNQMPETAKTSDFYNSFTILFSFKKLVPDNLHLFMTFVNGCSSSFLNHKTCEWKQPFTRKLRLGMVPLPNKHRCKGRVRTEAKCEILCILVKV